MASRLMSTRRLAEALKAEGFPLPEDCSEVRLVMGVNQAMLLQFDVYVRAENLVRLGRALIRIEEESR